VPLASVKKELFCPRCTARMSAVNEPSLGADVQFQRCFKCDAIWLNRGQFTRYKNHQKIFAARIWAIKQLARSHPKRTPTQNPGWLPAQRGCSHTPRAKKPAKPAVILWLTLRRRCCRSCCEWFAPIRRSSGTTALRPNQSRLALPEVIPPPPLSTVPAWPYRDARHKLRSSRQNRPCGAGIPLP
jgi:Zn-finger nucleic acid-binding protein